MVVAVRTFVRPDEKQTVFVIEQEKGIFSFVEEVEPWEEPVLSPKGNCFHCYPVVFNGERFHSLQKVESALADIFRWIREPDEQLSEKLK